MLQKENTSLTIKYFGMAPSSLFFIYLSPPLSSSSPHRAYLHTEKRKEAQEKKQTLEIDDAEFKFRVRVVFNPVVQSPGPVHPIFETVGYQYGPEKDDQLPVWVFYLFYFLFIVSK